MDERANARAFADIGLRLEDAIEPAWDAAMEANRVIDVPACLNERLLAGRLLRAPDHLQRVLFDLHFGKELNDFARLAGPGMARAVADMQAIQTADPGLRGGRTAWRRIARVYATLAALPIVDICAQARAFVRSGYRPTPEMTRSRRTRRMAGNAGGIDRRLARAVTRLEELGVPEADATVFDSLIGDGNVEPEVTAAQAPAPSSSPSAVLRASS